MEMVGATGGVSKARMPEMNAQRLCRTQSQQSVHKEARVMVQGKGWMFFQNGCEDGEGRCNGRGQARSPTKSGWDSAVLEGSMLEQLHRCTHENINTLSVSIMF